MQTHNFELFADYFQFYLQDEEAKGDLSNSWTPEATDRMLTVAPGTIGIGTVRNAVVPVSLEIHDAEPMEDFAKWDSVVECDLEVASGQIVIAGCTDYFPSAARVGVAKGSYRARVFYGGLQTIDIAGLYGDDHYRVVLWPAAAKNEIVILKPREESHG